MDDEIGRQKAMILFERAYRHQLKGEYADAIILYEQSLAVQPTAEAYTFLGWTYSMLDRYEEAVDCCKKAIDIDPEYGNPYNDIGAYMIAQRRWEEAIPWLEKAAVAARYESPEFAYMNLGRAYEQMGRYRTALGYYNQALTINPLYRVAFWARQQLIGKMN